MQWPILHVLRSRATKVVRRRAFFMFFVPPDFFTPAMLEELESLRIQGVEHERKTGVTWSVDTGTVTVYPGLQYPGREIDEALQGEQRAELAREIVERHFEQLSRSDGWDGTLDQLWEEVGDRVHAAKVGGRLSRRAIERINRESHWYDRQGIEFLVRHQIKKVTSRGFLAGKMAL